MDPRYVQVEHEKDVLRLKCTQCKETVDEWTPLDGPPPLLFTLVRESLRHSCSSVVKILEAVPKKDE